MNSHFLEHALKSRFLRFNLSGEDYTIPLYLVREVMPLAQVRPEPQMPIIDLAAKLGHAHRPGAEQTVIICTLEGFCLGLLVDSIKAVVVPAPEQFFASNAVMDSKFPTCIAGFFSLQDGKVPMINPAAILSAEEIIRLTSTKRSAA